jgi:hypothetical protein
LHRAFQNCLFGVSLQAEQPYGTGRAVARLGKSRRKWSEKKFAQTLSLKERENENAGARALLGQLPSFKAAVALIGRLYSRHSSLYER